MDWVAVILGSIIGSEIYQWIKNRTKYKYRWKCPHCQLSISASSQAIINIVKDTHTDHGDK